MPSIRQQIEAWKARLLDLSRRNRLLNLRPGQAGTVTLIHPAAEALFETLVRRKRRMAFAAPLTLEQRLAALSWDGPATGTTMRLDRLPTPPPGPGKLATDLQPDDQERALYNIHLRARTALTEQGVNILFVGLGLLEWFEPALPEEVLRSPLLLLPVQLQRAPLGAEYTLQLLDDEIVLNPTLAQKLRQDYGLLLPELPDEVEDLKPQQLFDQISALVAPQDGWRVLPEMVLGLFSFLKLVIYHDLEHAGTVAIDHPLLSLLAGVTAAPSLPLLPPLDATLPESVFQVLDADSSQQEAIATACAGASFVLHGPPGTGKSQTIANVIAECLASGKRVLFVSEKMAALQVVFERLRQCGLSDFCLELHSYKTGKRVVLEALRSCLEVPTTPGAPANSGQLDSPVPGVEQGAQTAASFTTGAVASGYAELSATRAELNKYVAALHSTHGPLNWTAYHVYARLARLADAPDCDLSLGNIDAYTSEQLGAIDALLVKLEARRDLIRTLPANLWRGCAVVVGSFEQRGRIRNQLRALLQALAEVQATAQLLADQLGLPTPAMLSDVRTLEALVLLLREKHVYPERWIDQPPTTEQRAQIDEARRRAMELNTSEAQLMGRYQPAVLDLDIDALSDRFAHQHRSWTRVLRPQYYRDVSELRTVLRAGQPFNPSDALSELQLAAEVRAAQHWLVEQAPTLAGLLGPFFQGRGTDWAKLEATLAWVTRLHPLLPRPLPQQLYHILTTSAREPMLMIAQQFEGALAKLHEALQFFSTLFPLEVLPAALADWAIAQRESAQATEHITQEAVRSPAQLLERMGDLDLWWEFCELRREAEPLGIITFIDLLSSDVLLAREPRRAFHKHFCQLWLDNAYKRLEPLRNFQREQHEALIERFRRLDQEQLLVARGRLRQLLAARRPLSTEPAEPGSELAILRRELQKQRRHKPIRQLLREIPTLLGRLKPCLLMSPLSVSQFLDLSIPPFDLVIFDEASQIRTEEAIGALLRGKTLVVVGDNRQLPPTNFFLADEGAGTLEETEAPERFESILDAWVAAGLPTQLLRWHYRSRHEALIAFSNTHLYDRRLATFPAAAPNEDQGVSFVHVPEGVYDRQGTRTNMPEVRRVVDLVCERFRANPTRSLGVVTFSQPQQLAVLHELERRRAADASLDPLFAEDRDEPFFVKNLENVQGDERDIVIVSVGYGRDAAGRLLMQFGPLNQQGGERRLNVAITRAREQVVLISSILPEEIDLKRVQHAGPRLLRAYMEYARNGGPFAEPSSSTPIVTSLSIGPIPRFEDDLAAALAARGLVLKRQVGHSDFRIDIAICDPEAPERYLLGIECDGDDYRDAPTARDRERLREQVLAILGWRLHRGWSAAWAHDAEAEIERVFQALGAPRP